MQPASDIGVLSVEKGDAALAAITDKIDAAFTVRLIISHGAPTMMPIPVQIVRACAQVAFPSSAEMPSDTIASVAMPRPTSRNIIDATLHNTSAIGVA